MESIECRIGVLIKVQIQGRTASLPKVYRFLRVTLAPVSLVRWSQSKNKQAFFREFIVLAHVFFE